jgi:hypothetical protein
VAFPFWGWENLWSPNEPPSFFVRAKRGTPRLPPGKARLRRQT